MKNIENVQIPSIYSLLTVIKMVHSSKTVIVLKILTNLGISIHRSLGCHINLTKIKTKIVVFGTLQDHTFTLSFNTPGHWDKKKAHYKTYWFSAIY